MWLPDPHQLAMVLNIYLPAAQCPQDASPAGCFDIIKLIKEKDPGVFTRACSR